MTNYQDIKPVFNFLDSTTEICNWNLRGCAIGYTKTIFDMEEQVEYARKSGNLFLAHSSEKKSVYQVWLHENLGMEHNGVIQSSDLDPSEDPHETWEAYVNTLSNLVGQFHLLDATEILKIINTATHIIYTEHTNRHGDALLYQKYQVSLEDIFTEIDLKLSKHGLNTRMYLELQDALELSKLSRLPKLHF